MPAGEIAQVEQLSEGLVAEFEAHYRANAALSPDIERRAVFEAWMIQKLAALQWATVALWRQAGSPDLRPWGPDQDPVRDILARLMQMEPRIIGEAEA